MKPWRIALVLIIVVGLLGTCVGGQFLKMQAASKKQNDELVKANVAKVEKGNVVVTVIETGSLVAQESVEIRSRVGGRISKLLVDEGDFVKRGDLIAVIDPQETELQVRQQGAQVKGAKANLSRLDVEISQRRITAQTNLQKARLRVKQIETELKEQPAISRANVTSAETAVETARQSQRLLVEVTQPNAKIQLSNNVADSTNSLEKANIELARRQYLYERGIVSKRDVEQAELQVQLDRTRLAQAEEAFSRLANEQKLELGQANQRIRQAQADLQRARSGSVVDTTKQQQYQLALQDLKDAEAGLKDIQALAAQRTSSAASVEQVSTAYEDAVRQLGETRVVAPMDGIVTHRAVQVGELVSPQSAFSQGTTIVAVENRSAMLVKLQINEIDVAKLRLGMEAEISVDALPKESFTGEVSKIAPAMISSQPGQMSADAVVKYEVEVLLHEVSSKIKSGMSAKCTMTAASVKDVLRVPIEYLGSDADGEYIQVRDDTVKPKMDMTTGRTELTGGKRVTVRSGVQNSSYAEIRGQVKVGDEIIKPKFTGPQRKGMMQFGGGEDEEVGTEEAEKKKADSEASNEGQEQTDKKKETGS